MMNESNRVAWFRCSLSYCLSAPTPPLHTLCFLMLGRPCKACSPLLGGSSGLEQLPLARCPGGVPTVTAFALAAAGTSLGLLLLLLWSSQNQPIVSWRASTDWQAPPSLSRTGPFPHASRSEHTWPLPFVPLALGVVALLQVLSLRFPCALLVL